MWKRIYPVFGIVCLCLLIFITPAAAQDISGFEENFSDPALPGWEHSQDVVVQDGTLRINPGNMAFHIGAWQEITLQFQIKYSDPSEVVIHYYASELGNYHLHILPDLLVLMRGQPEQEQELGVVEGFQIARDQWVSMQIQVQHGSHTVQVDGQTVMTAQDDNPLPGGGVGFTVHGENYAEFQTVLLSGQAVAPAMLEPPPEVAGEQAAIEQPPAAEPGQPLPQAEPLNATPQATAQTEPSSLIESLFTRQTNPVEMQTFVINLALAAVLAFILGRVYIHWGASLSNRRKFAANFMLMAVTTTFIILVVRSSVALSLGLVGALSIVRFRSAIKEPEELAYLFLAVGIGIGLGDNQRMVTLVAFAVAVLVLGLMRLLRRSQADVNLHLNLTTRQGAQLDLQTVMDILKPHCSKVKLLRFDELDSTLELSFLIELDDLDNLNKARDALKSLDPGMQISFLDNKGIW